VVGDRVKDKIPTRINKQIQLLMSKPRREENHKVKKMKNTLKVIQVEVDQVEVDQVEVDQVEVDQVEEDQEVHMEVDQII
jgi:hypothetical protein